MCTATTVSLSNDNSRLKDFMQRLVDLFHQQNLVLATHSNSSIYNTLAMLMPDTFEGIYLEPNPCFICNNIETPIVNIKLNSIKSDSKYTTNQQIFKLNGTYSISKMLIKISEIRKSKMVAAINICYTNKSNQSIVDLKMNNKLWLKAKRCHVQPGQQELKIDFQLPIIGFKYLITIVIIKL